MRYLYSQKVHSRDIGTGVVKTVTLKPYAVKRPKSFNNARLPNESFKSYKKRRLSIKAYVSAMRNGVNKIPEKNAYLV